MPPAARHGWTSVQTLARFVPAAIPSLAIWDNPLTSMALFEIVENWDVPAETTRGTTCRLLDELASIQLDGRQPGGLMPSLFMRL